MEIRVRGYKKSYQAGFDECNEMWKAEIKCKIDELENKRKKYYRKDLSKAQHDKSMKMWGAICYLKELLDNE